VLDEAGEWVPVCVVVMNDDPGSGYPAHLVIERKALLLFHPMGNIAGNGNVKLLVFEWQPVGGIGLDIGDCLALGFLSRNLEHASGRFHTGHLKLAVCKGAAQGSGAASYIKDATAKQM